MSTHGQTEQSWWWCWAIRCTCGIHKAHPRHSDALDAAWSLFHGGAA